MVFNFKSLKHAVGYFVFFGVGYQVVWYFAFQHIFHYQTLIDHEKSIVFIKLMGELLLYTVFSICFVSLPNSVSKMVKYPLCGVALLLSTLTFYASLQYINIY